MAHIRQSIRDNAVTAVTGLSTTGSNVFRSRVYPLGTNKLPNLLRKIKYVGYVSIEQKMIGKEGPFDALRKSAKLLKECYG